MKSRNLTIAMTFTASLLASSALVAPALADGVVTIYSADGLHDGNGSWFETEFAAFTKATGITVQYIEAGSGGVVERVAKEKSNPQADVLVTLPPFIQRAAAQLRSGGSCWLTANRHLPYEAILKPLFRRVTLVAEADGYKIYQAQK